MTIFKLPENIFLVFKKIFIYIHITSPPCINKDMKYRYFQYRLKPTKEQRDILEFYDSATRWVWNYFLELNQAALNIQREAINILNWTGTFQIQARGDTSGGWHMTHMWHMTHPVTYR
jgi:hypothetical protein